MFRTYLYLHQPKSFLADLYRLKKNIKRKKSFDEFTKKHLLFTSHHYVNEDDMSELNTQFDAFICGSDQIWNLECTKEIVPAYFLNFVANNKLKIAYAPSIASATFDGNKEELTNLIGRLDSVSVREKSTIDSVKEYTDKEINNVVDPTLLLEVQDYRKIENNNMENVKEYIFFYQLKEDGFKMAKWCEKLSKDKKNYQLFIFIKIKSGNLKMENMHMGLRQVNF